MVDPKTGIGLVQRSSVTVVAPSGILSDSFSSAICVLGPEKGMPVARKQKGIEVLVVEKAEDGSLREHRTEELRMERVSD